MKHDAYVHKLKRDISDLQCQLRHEMKKPHNGDELRLRVRVTEIQNKIHEKQLDALFRKVDTLTYWFIGGLLTLIGAMAVVKVV
jgi:hypothetical protein